MSKRLSLTIVTFGMICMLGITANILGVTAIGGAVAQNQTQQPLRGTTQKSDNAKLPKPILDTHHLMEYFNQSIYQNLRSEMEAVRTAADDYSSLEKRGGQAAEIANLVAIRNNDYDKEKWLEHAGNMQQAGLQLKKAANSQNEQKIRNAYHNLIQSCNECHTTLAPASAPQIEP